MAVTAANLLAVLTKLKSHVFGPRLIRVFPVGGGSPGTDYEGYGMELLCDMFLRSLFLASSLCMYSSPIIFTYCYRRGMVTSANIIYLCNAFTILATGTTIVYVLRGISRISNPVYNRFMTVLHEAKQQPDQRELLQAYDFEFSAWPVDFRWDESSLKSRDVNFSNDNRRSESIIQRILRTPRRILVYMVAHGFARAVIFPGSVKLLQNAMAAPLNSGRALLIEKNGRRAKLLSKDSSEIDTMFLDRRNIESNGDTLVICSEGNAGFYEVGCMVTPKNGGYSVLGWNHPGFAGSSGVPSPTSVQNAIDVVVKYAVDRLGFQLKDIILFAWSIGGYATSCAATLYPDVKAVFIDATFDDVMPLAEAKMPDAFSGIVKNVIRDYFSLNIAQNLVRQYVPATNRANFLLLRLLVFRYPNVMSRESCQAVMDFLSAPDVNSQDGVLASFGYNESLCESVVGNCTGEQWPTFPAMFGEDWDADIRIQVALFLARKYMVHYDSTHCSPLPTTFFQIPWQHR
eukprot:gene15911-17511_t